MGRELPRPPKQVDLHADAFISSLDEYEINELLGESIELMREMLDAAIYWEYSEIRFIHGKGKGVLRQAVYEELAYYKQSGAVSAYYPSYNNNDIVIVTLSL